MKQLLRIFVIWTAGLTGLSGAEPMTIVLELGNTEVFQRIEVGPEVRELEFFVMGEGDLKTLEGSLQQTAGSLLVPAKDSNVNCTRVFSDKKLSLWKLTVSLPEQKQPAGYALVLKESKDGRLLTKGLIHVQKKDSSPDLKTNLPGEHSDKKMPVKNRDY